MRRFHTRDLLLAGPVLAACVCYVLTYLTWDDFPLGPNPQDYMIAAGNVALLMLLPLGYLWLRDRRIAERSMTKGARTMGGTGL